MCSEESETQRLGHVLKRCVMMKNFMSSMSLIVSSEYEITHLKNLLFKFGKRDEEQPVQ